MKKIIISVLSIILISPALCYAQGKNVVKAVKGAVNAAKGGAKASLFSGPGAQGALNTLATDGQLLFNSAIRAAENTNSAKTALMRSAFKSKYPFLNIEKYSEISVFTQEELHAAVVYRYKPGKTYEFLSKGTNIKVFGPEGTTHFVQPKTENRLRFELSIYDAVKKLNMVFFTDKIVFNFGIVAEGATPDLFLVARGVEGVRPYGPEWELHTFTFNEPELLPEDVFTTLYNSAVVLQREGVTIDKNFHALTDIYINKITGDFIIDYTRAISNTPTPAHSK